MAEPDRSVTVRRMSDARAHAITNRHGRVLLADEPAALGGSGRGFGPFELIAAGLGACTSITLLMYARRKNIELQDVAVDARFLRGGESGYERDTIERRIAITGTFGADDVARLQGVARRCPVHIVLERAIDIVDEITVVDDLPIV